jgi:hypothetical protein
MDKRNARLAFIKKAIIFMLLIFALDNGLGRLLRYLYFHQSSGFLYRRTWAIESTTAPVIVFGDSRAAHSYAPQPFEEAFGGEFYNAGCDGTGIDYQEAVLTAVLKRYRPRILFLELRPFDFEQDPYWKTRLTMLLPYLKRHPEIGPVLKRRGLFENIKRLSQIYPFNSNILSIIMGNLEINKKRREDFKGFIPLEGVWDRPLRAETPPRENLRAEAVTSFRNFMGLAISRGITPVIIVSPIYQKWARPPQTLSMAAAICREFDVPFLDFSQDGKYLKREYFYDETHLNEAGAIVFSTEVAARISGRNEDP